MGEAINVVVAFAVIFFLVRWATKGGDGGDGARRARDLLGFQPKTVTPEMISTVQTMFPDIPRENIQYDLLKTGNVQMTSNKLLERGFLEAPPQAFFELFPTEPARPAAPAPAPSASASASAAAAAAAAAQKPSLITRYHLEARLRADDGDDDPAHGAAADPGGSAAWEDTPARREASLRERKAQMVLAARRRFLEQEQAQAG